MVNLIEMLQLTYYHLIPAHKLPFSITSITCYKQVDSLATYVRIADRFFNATLMTDYYGAFSASTSNFPGQIQSIIIDASSKSILTCLYNNEKNLEKSFE